MFIVAGYIYENYRDMWGYRVVIRLLLEHFAPLRLSAIKTISRIAPIQKASSYG